MRFLLLALLLCGVAACSSPRSGLPPGVRTSIPTPDVDLSVYQAPASLAGVPLLGEISSENQHARLFRYLAKDGGVTLDVSLYPQPGGWELMDDERRVAGHYGPVRQALAERMIRQGASEVSSDHEALRTTAAGRVIASGRLVAEGGRTPEQWLLLTTHGQVFVRLTLSSHAVAGEQGDTTAEMAELALDQFLQASGQDRLQQPGQ